LGNAHKVHEAFSILLSSKDYGFTDVGRAFYALSYDLAKMERLREGSCDAYISASKFAELLSENKLIELIRTYGEESDLPEFNKKRKSSKDDYIAILINILTIKFNDNIEEVSDLLRYESTIRVKKGFGFGA
jgi:putative lipoic acid-binding regulatory protein